MNGSEIVGALLATLSALMYAATSILVRRSRLVIDDHGLLLTTVVNVVILAVALGVVGLPDPGAMSIEGVVWFAGAGLFAGYLGRAAFFGGIRRIGAARAGALKNTTPAFSVIGAMLLLGEIPSAESGIGMAIALLGIALLVFEAFREVPSKVSDLPILGGEGVPATPSPAPGWAPRGDRTADAGMLFSVGAAVFLGLGQVLRAVGVGFLPYPVFGAFVASSTSLVIHVATSGVRGRLPGLVVASFGRFSPALVGAGLTSTVGTLSFFLAIQHLSVGNVSVIAASEVLFTVLLSMALLRRQESVKPVVLVACVLVFAGAAVIAAT